MMQFLALPGSGQPHLCSYCRLETQMNKSEIWTWVHSLMNTWASWETHLHPCGWGGGGTGRACQSACTAHRMPHRHPGGLTAPHNKPRDWRAWPRPPWLTALAMTSWPAQTCWTGPSPSSPTCSSKTDLVTAALGTLEPLTLTSWFLLAMFRNTGKSWISNCK